jgi:hypothetical protein
MNSAPFSYLERIMKSQVEMLNSHVLRIERSFKLGIDLALFKRDISTNNISTSRSKKASAAAYNSLKLSLAGIVQVTN